MSETRRSVLKKGIAAATATGLGLTATSGSASATGDTVVEVRPESTSSGSQSYEIQLTNATSVTEKDGSMEGGDDFDTEDGEIVFFGDVEYGVDDYDAVTTDAPENDVVVNRAENVTVYVNGTAIYP